jgi:hypothetical protein
MTDRIPVTDIAPEQYAQWRQHPVTRFMFQFMDDCAKRTEEELLFRWRAGALKMVDEQEGRGRVLQLRDIPEWKWASIQEFYGIAVKSDQEPTEEDNER